VAYSGLKAARLFYTSRPDVIARPKVVALYTDLLDRPSLADLAVADLRQWKEWGPADRVLALWKKDTHQAPFVRRALLGYALQCPGPAAAQLIATARQTDADLVEQAENVLKAEAQFAPPAPAKP
jgi:hypothetical protein